MKTDYVNVICKYMTWYKDLEINVITDSLYHTQPLLEVTDKWLGEKYCIFWVEDIPRIFKLIGLTRLCEVGQVNR